MALHRILTPSKRGFDSLPTHVVIVEPLPQQPTPISNIGLLVGPPSRRSVAVTHRCATPESAGSTPPTCSKSTRESASTDRISSQCVISRCTDCESRRAIGRCNRDAITASETIKSPDPTFEQASSVAGRNTRCSSRQARHRDERLCGSGRLARHWASTPSKSVRSRRPALLHVQPNKPYTQTNGTSDTGSIPVRCASTGSSMGEQG